MALPATCLSICSGIGGLDLGLRRAVAGLRTVCYVERDAFAASVLVARMEEAALDCAPIWDDLATFDGRPWRGVVDLVAGGTPCQDLSGAGRQAGLDGARSGLFFEFCRVVSETRPGWVFWENVASGQTGRALPRVIDALDGLGYTAARGPDGRPYVVLGADDVGAPHRRLRVFVLAYSAGERRAKGRPEPTWAQGRSRAAGSGGRLGHAIGQRLEGRPGQRRDVREELQAIKRAGGLAVAHAGSSARGPQPWRRGRPHGPGAPVVGNHGQELARPHGRRELQPGRGEPERWGRAGYGSLPPWPPGPGDTAAWTEVLDRWPHLAPAQPALRRVADGLSGWLDGARADRLRCLGNAVVPAQAELAWRLLWGGLTPAE